MVYHVLNGDALAYSFPETRLRGEIIVAREALVDGDVSGESLADFWSVRANFLGVDSDEYHQKTVSEFNRILEAPPYSTFYMWFEYDLFCQVNMWFVLSLIQQVGLETSVYVVYPSHLDRDSTHFWNGFGPASTYDLIDCFERKLLLSKEEILLGHQLWYAYKNDNLDVLTSLSKKSSSAFPYLRDVVNAHIDRFPKDGQKGRPEKVIEEIVQNVSTEFPTVCREFWKRESIYGFGDTQVKTIYDRVMMSC
ncbi:MAG: hypothetical protein KDC49_12625 [Saprospiraceae bacterium]|nr:hypothetical protein [Saprospiraceae bacterium]